MLGWVPRPGRGRDRNFLVGRDPKKTRSRPTTGRDPEKKSDRDRGLRSRPKTGRDRIFYLGRYRFLNFWVDGPNHY